MTRILNTIATISAVLAISARGAPLQNFGPVRSKPAAPIAFSTDQVRLLDRKAAKYGINPNLLQATLTVELQRLDSKGGSDDPQVFEWMAEQSSRVLRHLLETTDDAYSVLKYYAAGGVFPESQTGRHRAAVQFASQADAIFRRLQKEHPWKSR
jgi:hypothetical protein